MFVAWVLFPLVLLAVCLGCGLLVERLAGWSLPGALLPSLGLALVIVGATLTTSRESIAPLTTAVVVALALAGYASSWRRLRALRPEPLAIGIGIGLFVICAAPVVVSGNAAFLGYFVDNDSTFHFALIDQLLSHGQDLSAVPPSAYGAALHGYIGTSYPTGADVALGAVRPLVGQDVAWILQPYLAAILALGGVAIYELLRLPVRSRWLRALCAFIAAQPALLYAAYLEDGIKELATAWLITATVVLVGALLRRRVGLRGAVPLLITAIAGLDVLEIAAVPWLGLPLLVFAVVALWRGREAIRRMPVGRLALLTAASAAVALALVEPIITRASTFFSVATSVLNQNSSPGSAGTQLGNLAGPLQNWQMLGIWPTADFRVPPVTHYAITYALLGVALSSAALGSLWMLRRRAWGLFVLLVGTGVATAYLLGRASPYASAKVMMIFSVTAVVAAMFGAVALHDSGRRAEGWLIALVIAGGVLWSNALQYQGSSIAPRGRFAELAMIGGRFNGNGPTFVNQADEYAVHFLRTEAPSVPGAFGPLPPERPGLALRGGDQARLPWDPNEVALPYLEGFRLLVLGRSPLESRPPADFSLAYRGSYYEVWRHTTSSPVIEHVSLDYDLYHGAVPSCRLVRSIASRAVREHAQLAYSAGAPYPTMVPTHASQAADWGPVAGNPYEIIPGPHPGPVIGSIPVDRPGRYRVWLEASLTRHVSVSVGGQPVASIAYYLGPPGQFLRLGQVLLQAGSQPVRIAPTGSSLDPGQTADDQFLGPVVLVPDGASPPQLSVIAARDARSLCGRWLHWIEIVR